MWGVIKARCYIRIANWLRQGKHFGFEPIPSLYRQLKQKFSKAATILPYALSDKKGTTTFNYVKNAPAYSGINKRTYEVANYNMRKSL